MDYFKIIELNGKRLAVYKTGEIVFWNGKKWKINNGTINDNGYVLYNIGKKRIRKHRIIGYAFLNLNINDTTQLIDHINNIRSDNRLENLRIVSHQQNHYNRNNVKGYTKIGNKYQTSIIINGCKKYFGKYNTEEEAHQAYLDAKELYHKF